VLAVVVALVAILPWMDGLGFEVLLRPALRVVIMVGVELDS
jgi:hypothetical protein